MTAIGYIVLFFCVIWCHDVYSSWNTSLYEIPILFMGDSTMIPQHDSAVNRGLMVRSSALLIRNPCLDAYSVSATLQHAQKHLKRPPMFVYLNLQSLHLLHLYPVRPWVMGLTCACGFNDTCTSNFLGYVNLERWFESLVEGFLSAETNVRAVVIQTPNSVCEGVFAGKYRVWFDSAEDNYKKCAGWVMENGIHRMDGKASPHTTAVFQHLPQNTTFQEAEDLCRNGVMARNGTDSVARRIRKSVQDMVGRGLRVGMVDATDLTGPDQCSHTADGRHYDTIVIDRQLDALSDALTRFY